MEADTSSMSQREKSAFASRGVPDPRFENVDATEGGFAKKKVRKTRRRRRSKKLVLKFRKTR